MLSKLGKASKSQLQNRTAVSALLSGSQQRGYFSLMDRVKDKIHQPLRHIKSYMEPDGQNYESQLPEGYRLHGNTAAHFSASITHNALEMH